MVLVDMQKVSGRVADGYRILAIKRRKTIAELLEEGFELLEGRYGNV